MELKILRAEEVPLLAPLGGMFWEEAGFPGSFHGESFAAGWAGLIESGQGVIFGLLDRDGTAAGGIGGFVAPDFNTASQVAMESFWFLRPDLRGGRWGREMFQRFEEWARGQNADRIFMMHSTAPQMRPRVVGRFYRGRGYRPVEVYYVKEVNYVKEVKAPGESPLRPPGASSDAGGGLSTARGVHPPPSRPLPERSGHLSERMRVLAAPEGAEVGGVGGPGRAHQPPEVSGRSPRRSDADFHPGLWEVLG